MPPTFRSLVQILRLSQRQFIWQFLQFGCSAVSILAGYRTNSVPVTVFGLLAAIITVGIALDAARFAVRGSPSQSSEDVEAYPLTSGQLGGRHPVVDSGTIQATENVLLTADTLGQIPYYRSEAMAPPGNSFLIPCSPSHSTNHLIMFAGSLHGITKDSAFDIFKSDSSRPDLQDVLATLRVTEVQSHVSHLLITPPLTSLFDSPHSKRQYWYARLKKASGPPVLNIYCDDSGILERICTENSESRITVAFDVTENPDEADLCLIVEENDVSFRIGKRLRADIEFPSQFSPYSPFPVNHIADIRNFINRFAHFIFHLMPGGLGPMTDFVCFEMNKLGRNGRNFYRDSVVVLRKVKNGGLAEVVLSEDRYGFTIHNNYDDDLHVYLLYFDASTLEIDIWYSSPMTQNKGSVDAFLKKKSLLVMEKMLMSCTQW